MDQFTADGIYLPIQTELVFDLVPGQGQYLVGQRAGADVVNNQIIDVSYCRIVRGEQRYEVKVVANPPYNNTLVNYGSQANQGRPFVVYFRPTQFFGELNFYFIPDDVYQCRLEVKQRVDQLMLQQDLTPLPRYYDRFLRYALARELSNVYPSANWTPTNEQEYQRVFRDLRNANKIDLTSQAIGLPRESAEYYFDRRGFYYGY